MERSAAVELLHQLVAIRSVSRQESEASHWLASQMHNVGFNRAFVDAAGNAVGEMGDGSATRTIVLLGHIDTVPGNITVRVESRPDGDVLYGRGSVDAKGPLATFVAACARLGEGWTRRAGLRVVVVGAVEEEAATSKGARYIASRFNGRREPVPNACVVGEPSGWHRITLGYKGRLLLDLEARQPMSHTAGPDASVAAVVVDVWNWVNTHAQAHNTGRERTFDQLSPSLRRFITSTSDEMIDTVDAQIAWRVPLGADVDRMVRDLVTWTAVHIGAPPADVRPDALISGEPCVLEGERTTFELRFRGAEPPWRGDRQNALVTSLLGAIRNTAGPGTQPGFLVKTGTSDMNVVGPVWRCPIVAYGPGDSSLDHTPHEHVSLEEYWRAIIVLEHALRIYGETAP